MCTKNKVNQLTNTVKNVIESFNRRKSRLRKLNYSHLFFVKLLTVAQNYGIKIATSHLKVKVSHQSLHKMSQLYGLEFVKQLNLSIRKLFPLGKRRFLAVDGSRISMNKKIAHKESCFQLTKSGSYTTSLLTSVYDIDNKIPVALNLTGHHNERDGFLDCLDHLRKGDCLIFDRGYYSYDLLKKLKERELDFIFRIKSNSKLLKEPLNGTRTVSYLIGNKS